MSSLSELMAKPQIALSFTASSSGMFDEDEIVRAVREALAALAQPYGEAAASLAECQAQLEMEGVNFPKAICVNPDCDHKKPFPLEEECPDCGAAGGYRVADPGQRVTAELADRKDWEAGVKFLESLPKGSWTSFGDFGRASGVSVGTNASSWLQKEWDRRAASGKPHIENIHRVLNVNGELKNSWLPDDQASTLTPIADIESIAVGKVSYEQEGDSVTWTGSAEIDCRLPSNWSDYVDKHDPESVERVSAHLERKLGEKTVRTEIQNKKDHVMGELTRDNSLQPDPLLWIKFDRP